MRFSHLALTLLLAAGCLDGAPAAEEQTSSGSGTHPPLPAPDNGPDPLAPIRFDLLNSTWNECFGLGTDQGWPRHDYGLGNFSAAEPPAGWNSSQGVGYSIVILALECKRVSWGQYERGPVTLLLEIHDNVETPERCRTTEQLTDSAALASIWISDPDLAALAASFGMRTYTGPLSVMLDAGEATEVSARWNVLGGAESTLATTVPSLPDVENYRGFLIYWHDGHNLWRLKYDSMFTGPAQPEPILVVENMQDAVVTGHMAPPMLTGETYPDWAGAGEVYSQADLTMSLTRFKDNQCTPE